MYRLYHALYNLELQDLPEGALGSARDRRLFGHRSWYVDTSFGFHAENAENLHKCADDGRDPAGNGRIARRPCPGKRCGELARHAGQTNRNAIWVGMVDLEWNEIPGADSYDVQYFHVSSWIDLPAEDEDDDLDIDIAFYGAGAIVNGLSHSGSYTFRVRAVNSHGASEWSEYGWIPQTDRPSAWVDVPEPTNVPATGEPAVSGRLNAGELLAADTSGISDDNGLDRIRFYYQWISSDGTTDTDIEGATEESYLLSEDENRKSIKVRVSFTDRHGFRESLTGAATGVVGGTATGMLTINGTARVGETLTVSATDIQDEDGLDNAIFSYQWVSSNGTADTDIEGETAHRTP